jgi:hypothetical protein
VLIVPIEYLYCIAEGPRALRSAEQGSPGGRRLNCSKAAKGGTTIQIVKKVLRKAGVDFNTALVVTGWVTFTLGSFVKTRLQVFAFVLLAVARVLP